MAMQNLQVREELEYNYIDNKDTHLLHWVNRSMSLDLFCKMFTIMFKIIYKTNRFM